MDASLKQSEVYKLLKERGFITVSRESFRDMIKRGVIPVAKVVKKKKYFIYDDVVQALIKSGLGKPQIPDLPKTIHDELDNIKPPKPNQTKEEYGADVVSKLGSSPTITEANIYKQIYSGKLEKLKYEQQMGELISRQEVEDKAFSVARAIRDKILSIPERMSNELASLSEPHQIKELLYKEFGLMLDGFSEESFYD